MVKIEKFVFVNTEELKNEFAELVARTSSDRDSFDIKWNAEKTFCLYAIGDVYYVAAWEDHSELWAKSCKIQSQKHDS